jgi:hypothetical protein
MADRPITRRLKIFINGEEIDNTISSLRRNLRKFRNQANSVEQGSEAWKKYNRSAAEAELAIDKAYKAQRAFREDVKLTENGIDNTTNSLSEFTASIGQYFNGLRTGNYLDVQEGFNGIKTGIKGATRAAIAFIATPIGAAIAALAGIGIAAKAWFDYNQQVVEALRLTQQITGLTDQAADQARIRAEALVETFDVDFKETLISAKNLAQQFGISFDEAFDVIEGQLVRGQKNNDEFFDSLKEYPTFFNQAGFSAQEFGKIIAAGFDLGIYQDKLPDALKEADLALKEQTKTTRDALVNAFGAAFTDDILKRIRTGETTTKDALAEISAQADKTGINVQQNAQLTADLFKGAGEDAGGALQVFNALNTALNEQQRELTESEKITQEQIKATTELKQVSSALFSTGDQGFGLLIDKAKLFGTKLLVDILKIGVDVYNWFVDLNNESRTFSALLTVLATSATAPFKVIGETISLIVKQFKSLGTVIEGVFTLDPDKIKEGFSQGFDNIGEAIDNLKKKAQEDAEAIRNAFAGNNELERKNIDDFITASPTSNTEGNQNQNEGDGDGNLTPQDQKVLDSRKKLYEQLKQLEEEQEILKELDKLDKDQRDEEEEILRKEQEFEKLIADAEFDKELKKGFEEALQFEIQQIRDKYAEKRLEQKQKEEERLTKLDAETKQKLIDAETKYQQAKENVLKTGLNVLRSVFGQQQEIGRALFLFEKGKAVADIVKSSAASLGQISASLAAANAISLAASPLTGGQPMIGNNILIAAKNAAAVKLNAAAQIGSILATTIQGFETGGESFDGPASGGLDGRGGRLAILHPEEYIVPKIVRKDPEVPAIINYLEQKRLRKIPSFNDGGNVPEDAEQDVTPNTTGLMLTEETGQEIITQLRNLKATVVFGFNEEIKRQELAEKLAAIERQSTE